MEGMNQRRKCILWNTPKVRAGQAGQRRERWPAEEAGRCGEGGRGRPVGLGGPKGKWSSWLLGRLGQKLKKKSFQNKNWIFEFIKVLEICTMRFRRNFDTRIFPKFF
jgi:hypothetical protein